MSRLNPALEATRKYLKTASGKALPVWLRTALVTWTWPPGHVPDDDDFERLAACMRGYIQHSRRKPSSPARAVRSRPKSRTSGHKMHA